MSHSWQKTLISQSDTIKQSLEIINNEALRVALVVDSNQHLVGVVTDGDIRRGLLKNLTLAEPVSLVMNLSPTTAKMGTRREALIELMEKKSILSIPLLDDEGKLVGLETLHGALHRPQYQNPVFLMAGGFGTRLRPLTNNCPKPMLKIGDKPILEQILLNFVDAGFYRFYISTHYMPEVIRDYFGSGEKWGVSIQYVHEDEPLGTGGALGLLPQDEIDQPLFMMNGDLLTSLNLHSFLEFHKTHNAIATMCVREYEHQVPYGVITSEGTQIKSMIEKPVHRFFVNAGIYLLEPALVKSVASDTCIDMPTLLEQQIGSNKIVNMFPIHEYWLDIGRMDDFHKAQAEVQGLSNG